MNKLLTIGIIGLGLWYFIDHKAKAATYTGVQASQPSAATDADHTTTDSTVATPQPAINPVNVIDDIVTSDTKSIAVTTPTKPPVPDCNNSYDAIEIINSTIA